MSLAKNILIRLFKNIGVSISAYDETKYRERENYFRYKKIYERHSAATMIPFLSYLNNLEIAEMTAGIAGDIVECGVWRGGMIAGIAEVLGRGRRYWLFDSFEGLPPAGPADGEAAVKWQQNKDAPEYYDNCRAEEAHAKRSMELAGATNARLVKGWFSDTVSGSGVGTIALLRLDGDWYESTMTCLEAFYPKVADGGIIIIDDYYFWDGCSKAVHDYLSTNKLSDRISQGRYGVAYIVKNRNINTFSQQ